LYRHEKFSFETLGLGLNIPSMSEQAFIPKNARPPLPNRAMEKRMSKPDIFANPNSLRKQNSRENIGLHINGELLCEEQKENNNSLNKTAASPVRSITCKSNTPISSHKSHFIIRRASPARTFTEKQEISQERPPPVKSSSVKYKNIVDKVQTSSSEREILLLLNDLPKISARSWVVVDGATGETLFGYKQTARREVASLTKLATLYTACKVLEDFQLDPDKITCSISQNAATKIGTSAYLKTNDQISLTDLLHGTQLFTRHNASIRQ